MSPGEKDNFMHQTVRMKKKKHYKIMEECYYFDNSNGTIKNPRKQQKQNPVGESHSCKCKANENGERFSVIGTA